MNHEPIHNNSSDAFLRFCWFRESAPGHLEHDGGIRIAKSDLLLALFGLHPAQQRTTAAPAVSLDTVLAALSGTASPDTCSMDTLPIWARKRLAIMLGPLFDEQHVRIAARNAGVLVDVAHRILATPSAALEPEVTLPYLDRRDWPNRFEILANTQFVNDAGRIVPAKLLSHQELELHNARLLATSSALPGVETDIVFTWSQPALPRLLSDLLPVSKEVQPALLNTEVDIQMSLPASACRAWNTAPIENSGAYFTSYAPVSVAVQSTLRRWLAWYWFSDLRQFADVQSAYTVLAYLVSRPFPGRRRTDFTYDPLSTDWIYFAFRCARRPLRTLLKNIHQTLLDDGQVELAARYHPDQAKLILDRVRKDLKPIRAIVAAEGAIVNHILKLGLELRGAKDPMAVANLAPDFAKGLGVRLRRLFREQDLTSFCSLLMIQATDALRQALGGKPCIRTVVTVREGAGPGNKLPSIAMAAVPEQSPFVPVRL